jgi:diacylglycerol kinase (ATP)
MPRRARRATTNEELWAEMRSAIIFNPTARGDKARHFHAALHQLSGNPVLVPTRCAGDARRLAREAALDGAETIVAAGGDGTVNEVLNGLVDADALGRTVLGVLPLGTTNVIAKELGLPAEAAEAWEVIQRGKTRVIDLPWARFQGSAGRELRCFAQMAGAGLDSRAIELVNWNMKQRLGYLAYVASGLRALSQDLPRIEVDVEGRKVSGQLVLIGNGKFYGGRFNLFPLADLADGLLEIVVYPRIDLSAVAESCLGMLTGDFHASGETIQLRSRFVTLRAERPAAFHLEGENVGRVPVEFGIYPQRLGVIVP